MNRQEFLTLAVFSRDRRLLPHQIEQAILSSSTFVTGSGDDTVVSGLGADIVLAGSGDDTVTYGTDLYRILTDQGGDVPFFLDGGRGIDTLNVSLGQAPDDVILVGLHPERSSTARMSRSGMVPRSPISRSWAT